jgi:hypothetical protein
VPGWATYGKASTDAVKGVPRGPGRWIQPLCSGRTGRASPPDGHRRGFWRQTAATWAEGRASRGGRRGHPSRLSIAYQHPAGADLTATRTSPWRPARSDGEARTPRPGPGQLARVGCPAAGEQPQRGPAALLEVPALASIRPCCRTSPPPPWGPVTHRPLRRAAPDGRQRWPSCTSRTSWPSTRARGRSVLRDEVRARSQSRTCPTPSSSSYRGRAVTAEFPAKAAAG